MKKNKRNYWDILGNIIEIFGLFLTALYLQPVMYTVEEVFREALEKYKEEKIVDCWAITVLGIAGIGFVWFLSTCLLYVMGLFLWGFSKIIWIVAKEIFNVLSVVFV